MSFLKKVSRHNGIIAISKSHFNSYNPLISRDFFSFQAFSFIIMKSREKIAGKFKCNFIKVLTSLCLAWWVFSCQAWTRYKLMKYFFFNSFISTSPSQPPILINFFFTRIVVILCEICSKNRRRPGNRIFLCICRKEKQRIINRRLIPSFSIKKKIRNKIFLPSYLTIPSSPVRYIEKIYISLSIISMFFCISCVTNKVTCLFQN